MVAAHPEGYKLLFVQNGCKMTVEGGNKSSSGTSLNSGHTFNHKQEAGSDRAKEEKVRINP